LQCNNQRKDEEDELEQHEQGERAEEPEALEKIVWNKSTIVKNYKIAVKNNLGQMKRVFYASSPFKYTKYNLIIKKGVLLAWKNWAIDHPGQDFEFWVGEGKNFERQAVADPKKFIVLKLRSEVVAKEGN
jgi:hypothetical protein